MIRLSENLRRLWRRGKNFCIHNVLHADDPPHKLALGIAVGMFVTFLPLIGIQMALNVALAWLVGANKAVGIPLVWISNPVTMVPVYYPGYWLGCKLLRQPMARGWLQVLQAEGTWTTKILRFMTSVADVAAPLFLGTFIIALGLAIVSYYSSLYVIRSYRMRRWGQLMPPKEVEFTPPAEA